MLKLICVTYLWFGMHIACGQGFRKVLEAKLPEPLTNVEFEWVAIDGDSLLDVLVTGVASDGKVKVMTFRNTAHTLQWKNTQDTGFKEGSFQLTDWNNDHRIDLLIAGKTTVNTNALFLFENRGDFTFQKTSKLLDQGARFRIGDKMNLRELVSDLLLPLDQFIHCWDNNLIKFSLGDVVRYPESHHGIRGVFQFGDHTRLN